MEWAKWTAAFYQLGFVSYERYNVNDKIYTANEFFDIISIPEVKQDFELTPAGRKLITAITVPEIEEIYTRQFVCYELPNSLERGFPDGSMKPFILLLQVLRNLQHNGHEGLTKFEIGLFLQKFRNHTQELPQEVVDEILKYRQQLSDCKNGREARELKNLYKEELGAEIGINPNSVVSDYSDTTFRYFSLSGLSSRVGQTFVIRANKIRFVETLLSSEPLFLFAQNPIEYFSHYYKNTFILPTDHKEFALSEIEDLKNGIRDKKSPLLSEANKPRIDSHIDEIRRIRFAHIEYNNWEREEASKNVIKHLNNNFFYI